MFRLIIHLEPEEYEALKEIAKKMIRAPRTQAHLIIRNALIQAHLIEPGANDEFAPAKTGVNDAVQ